MKTLNEARDDLAEKYSEGCNSESERPEVELDFKAGFDAAITHLRESPLEEFDERQAINSSECDHADEYRYTPMTSFANGARWQHSQDKARLVFFKARANHSETEVKIHQNAIEFLEKQIAQLKAENETIKACRDYTVYEEQKQEITTLKAQLAEKESHLEDAKELLQVAMVKDARIAELENENAGLKANMDEAEFNT